MPKKIPLRQCLGCRPRRPKRELLRVVRTPAGEVRLDLNGKVSGRGAYVCPDPECLKRAAKSGALGRALETEIPQEVFDALLRETEAVYGTR